MRALVLIIFIATILPANAKWLIDPNECNCEMRPISTGRKVARSLLVFEKQPTTYELVDHKTGKFLNVLKINQDGFYKVRGKWYKAKWQKPTQEELLQDLAIYQRSYPRFLPFLYFLSAPALYPHSSSQPLLNPPPSTLNKVRTQIIQYKDKISIPEFRCAA